MTASPVRCEKHMDAIVQALIIWISTNSQYSAENIALPAVVFMTPQEITEEYYSDAPDHIPDGGIDDRIWALYDAESSEDGVVYLRIDEASSETGFVATEGTLLSGQKTLAQSVLNRRMGSADNGIKSHQLESLFADDPVLTERLLHELVHHVQFQTGINKTFKCAAYGELEAYRLGGLYFNRRHIEDPMPNRNFWAHIYSRC